MWAPEPFDLARCPKKRVTVEVDSTPPSNFARSVKWSPDGSAILAQCENSSFRLYLSGEEDNILANSNQTTKVFSQASPVLDFTWFPTASVYDPASFCFAASVRECPVKLLDASDGRLRASYPIVDHRERQIAPHSLAFNLTAQRLYCGFENAIEVFDVSRPGEGTRIRTTPHKKSKDGLKGIVSALAFSPTYGAEESYFAAGSFTPSNNNIGLFSDSQDEPLMFLGGGPRAGVTQIQFNPAKPHILYASYRGSGTGSIFSWDIRSNIDIPIDIFETAGLAIAKTNQKLRFDVDLAGRMLGVGTISIFQFDTEVRSEERGMQINEPEFRTHKPTLQFKAHNDVTGSVAFHPFKPLLLSASGSRHFTSYEDTDPASDEDAERDPSKKTQHNRLQPKIFDSSVSIWNFANTPEMASSGSDVQEGQGGEDGILQVK
ncbi:hypothetical protein CPB83DRAFT_762561 [Crepidotus variabilis]|uniref:Telomerase Cajal body protein 1 n=1 Tax=Crepidotus variabilis TaxID=179855 RepID=A0A9P6EKZ6_9AGAR|nr:hypothetical protein CPB83DRAFT_762561 [Crepidotus variabilis]